MPPRASISGDGVIRLRLRIHLMMARVMIGLIIAAAGTTLSFGDASAQGPQLDSAGGMAGFNFYDAGEWGLVRSQLSNPGDRETTATLLIGFKDAPGVQFGDRVTLPPRSRREVLTLITPHGLPRDATIQGAELRVTLVEEHNGTERSVASATGIVAIRDPGLRSAIAGPSNVEGPGRLHGALREAAGLGPTTFTVSPRSAPHEAPSWGGLHTLVLAEDAGWSPAQLRAIRQWVFDGGRLWIMLDQIGPDLPRAILGDHWPLASLDRAAYTELTLRGEGVEHAVSRDYPIRMARVAAEAPAQVRLTAHGYPAAVTWRAGRGRVLATTLEASAWLDDDNAANAALMSLADFFEKDQGVPAASMARAASALQAATPRVHGLVGHRVLGRGAVVLILALFLGGLLIAGLWLMRRGRLEWAAPAGVGLGLVTAAVLVGVGWVTLAKTPGVAVTVEQRRVEAGAPTALSRAMLAVYRQPGASRVSRLGYDGPPPVLTDRLGAAGPRLVRTDADAWSIENMNLAPGEVHTLALAGVVEAPSSATIKGRLGERDLTLRFVGGSRPTLDDALLVTPRGRVALEPRGDGWRADLAQPLTGAQYIAATVLSQRQMQRSAVYAQLLGESMPVDRPMLMGWNDRSAVGVAPIDGVERRTDALLAYPVAFAAPEPGQTVRIPAMLMRMTPYRDRQLNIGGTIYDPIKRTWVENVSNAQTVAMTYRPPEAFAGIELIEAELTLDLRIPGRVYEVITVRDGRVATLARGENPGGLITLPLGGDDLPTRRADGSVLVGLRVGQGPLDQTPQPWTLSRMDLAVTGRAPAP